MNFPSGNDRRGADLKPDGRGEDFPNGMEKMDVATRKMDYRQVLEWMFSALPMFQKIGSDAYKPGLENTELLLEYLGNPHRGLRCIHVAGTNGKGSTSSMLASVLMEAGCRTALYTSPHLIDFRERMRVDGEMIPEDYVTNFVNEHFDFFATHSFSFFEMTTAMAFCWFRSQGVDVAVIETGLGGRLDSTNVVLPDLSIITNIALDHTAILGGTRPLIAAEKAGIVKPGVPVLIGENDPEIEPVFRQKAARENAPLYFAGHSIPYRDYGCPLEGEYQRFNIATVVSACALLEKAFGLTGEKVRAGIRNVVRNTHLQGRWQVLSTRPLVVCDTGHNVNGISEIVRQLEHTRKERLHIVFGMVNDKDVDGVLSLLPRDARYYFAQASVRRAMDSRELATYAARLSLQGDAYPDCRTAFQAAVGAAAPGDMVFVGGSTFVVADVLASGMIPAGE